jgi:alpha-1,3-rhamnosyl/mannosyltransferase
MAEEVRTKRVLVNDRCLYRGGAGISVYIRNVLAHWPEDSEVRPLCYCTEYRNLVTRGIRSLRTKSRPLNIRPLRELINRDRPGLLRVPYSIRRGIHCAFAKSFRKAFRRDGYAAYFEPNHIAIPSLDPTVTSIFDLSVLEHPQWHPRDRVLYWEKNLAGSLRSTRHWIVSSKFTRDRMVSVLGLPAESITVIPLAARNLPYPAPEQLPQMKQAKGLPQNYILHLGTVEPRKNLLVLLDAYAALPGQIRSECKLILAGALGWGGRSFWKSIAEHPVSAEGLGTGYVSDTDAALLLAGATAVVAPSRYEGGFILPLMEATACGTPVICSTAEAFRELAAGAVEMIDPDDKCGWTAALRKAFEDPQWRAETVRAAQQRCRPFSWERTARMHEQVFTTVVNT